MRIRSPAYELEQPRTLKFCKLTVANVVKYRRKIMALCRVDSFIWQIFVALIYLFGKFVNSLQKLIRISATDLCPDISLSLSCP